MKNTVPNPSVPHPAQTRTELSFARALRHLGRALLRRCPNCGAGRLFRRWVVMTPVCSGCRLRTDRGEHDYFIGSFVVNFVTAELLVCAGALIGILVTWPDVPWTALKWTLIGLMIPMPFLFYPWAKTIWLAIDLTFRPVTPNDIDGGTPYTMDCSPDPHVPLRAEPLGDPASAGSSSFGTSAKPRSPA